MEATCTLAGSRASDNKAADAPCCRQFRRASPGRSLPSWAGVASLVEALKASREMKSGFALYGLSRTAREVLELTRLIKVFDVFESEQEALAGLPNSASAS